MKTKTNIPCPDCGSPLHVSPLLPSLAVGHDHGTWHQQEARPPLRRGSWHLDDDVDLFGPGQIHDILLEMATMTRHERRRLIRDLRRKAR